MCSLGLSAENNMDYLKQKEKLEKEIKRYNNKIARNNINLADLRKMCDSLVFLKNKIECLKVEEKNQISEHKILKTDTSALDSAIKQLKGELARLRKSVKEDSISAEAFVKVEEEIKLKNEKYAIEYISRPMHKVSLDSLDYYCEQIDDDELLSLINACIKDKQAYDEICLNIDKKENYNGVVVFCNIIKLLPKTNSKRKSFLQRKDLTEAYNGHIKCIPYLDKRYKEYSELLINNPESSKIKDIEDEILSIKLKQ